LITTTRVKGGKFALNDSVLTNLSRARRLGDCERILAKAKKVELRRRRHINLLRKRQAMLYQLPENDDDDCSKIILPPLISPVKLSTLRRNNERTPVSRKANEQSRQSRKPMKRVAARQPVSRKATEQYRNKRKDPGRKFQAWVLVVMKLKRWIKRARLKQWNKMNQNLKQNLSLPNPKKAAMNQA
jgi:hypothetical protein